MTVSPVIARVKVIKVQKRGEKFFQLTVKVPPLSSSAWADPGTFAKLRAWDAPPTGAPFLDIPLSIHRFRPQEEELDFLIRPVGPGTLALTKVEPGTEIRLTGPLGRGLAHQDPNFPTKPFYLVAGGVGLAPMANLLDSLRGPATLFYGEKSGAALIDEAYLKSFAPNYLASAEDGLGYGRKGLVTSLLTAALNQEKRDLFACGPPGLLAALAPIADNHQIRYFAAAEAFMACGLGVCLTCSRPLKDPKVTAKPRIRLCVEGPVVDGLALDWIKS
ncbi:MAG: hypothetical protein LBI10_01515 [Deltaproteobacteria bacterium]|jgi:dihydroorotate dehydrogenase electron transfer subunit|nr:hypothetical protein [Deltaproteobacteria bacterium]